MKNIKETPRLADPLLIARYFAIWGAIVLGLNVATEFFVKPFLRPSINGAIVGVSISWGVITVLILMAYFLFLFSVLPSKRTTAVYLRPFGNDDRTFHWRNAISRVIDPKLRLSGIRAPRLRTPIVIRYINMFAFILRYATPRYMNLEAGDDWFARLWRSLGDARCCFVDLTGLTRFVAQEIRLVLATLGPDRVLFVGDRSEPEEFWRELVTQQLGPGGLSDASIQIARWDSEESSEGIALIEADVRRFVAGLPSGVAGVNEATFSQVADLATSIRNRMLGRLWYVSQAAVGVLVLPITLMLISMVSATLAPSAWVFPSGLAVLFIFMQVHAALNVREYIRYCGTEAKRRAAIRFSKWYGGLIAFSIFSMVSTIPPIQAAREAARRVQCINNMKQIGLAMQAYQSDYNCFPPDVVSDASGRPMHSWRVLLLPYLGERSLYSAYHFDQPWNDPDNINLASRMPAIYRCPSDVDASPNLTSYTVLTGPNGAYHGRFAPSIQWATDGSSQTLLVVESPAKSILWLEPKDITTEEFIDLHAKYKRGEIRANHNGGGNSVMMDGSIRFLKSSISPGILRALASPAGGEVIPEGSY